MSFLKPFFLVLILSFTIPSLTRISLSEKINSSAKGIASELKYEQTVAENPEPVEHGNYGMDSFFNDSSELTSTVGFVNKYYNWDRGAVPNEKIIDADNEMIVPSISENRFTLKSVYASRLIVTVNIFAEKSGIVKISVFELNGSHVIDGTHLIEAGVCTLPMPMIGKMLKPGSYIIKCNYISNEHTKIKSRLFNSL